MSIPNEILARKGARKVSEIDLQVLEYLNRGQLETKNLTEWLAVDQLSLLQHCLPKQWLSRIGQLEAVVLGLKKPSTLKITNAIGQKLLELSNDQAELADLEAYLLAHPSDSVRCWYGPLVSGQSLSLKVLINKLLPLAADAHFGCRELAFFALKPHLVGEQLEDGIRLLAPLVVNADENIRRFAVEATRPIGVWTTHLQRLKEEPALGLPILEPLKADPARYVQNAVANWLNDASKSSPDWVINLCQHWQQASDSKATAYIVKRGLRTINK
ncbi:MAG: DNA alkylation repair protein [Bacteroidota bacterium]